MFLTQKEPVWITHKDINDFQSEVFTITGTGLLTRQAYFHEIEARDGVAATLASKNLTSFKGERMSCHKPELKMTHIKMKFSFSR